jgi:hypothetical protein
MLLMVRINLLWAVYIDASALEFSPVECKFSQLICIVYKTRQACRRRQLMFCRRLICLLLKQLESKKHHSHTHAAIKQRKHIHNTPRPREPSCDGTQLRKHRNTRAKDRKEAANGPALGPLLQLATGRSIPGTTLEDTSRRERKECANRSSMAQNLHATLGQRARQPLAIPQRSRRLLPRRRSQDPPRSRQRQGQTRPLLHHREFAA